MNWQTLLSTTPASDYINQKEDHDEQIKKAINMIKEADAILIGAGAGLSTAAGLAYGGKRFTDNFQEFIDKYHSPYMSDMYSAGFYPFPSEEAKWGYWSKHSMINRILPEAMPLYQQIYTLVKEKEVFVITTNVDHQFYKAGFKDEDVFATQGDYGEIQCAKGCHPKVYDARELFIRMDQARKDCEIPSYMVPHCPVCGGVMAMHLRCDDTFVEDEHWHRQAQRYHDFLKRNKHKKVVLLELGVGFNTPVIIRFPFEKMAREHKNFSLIRFNLNEAFIPASLNERSVGINADIQKTIHDLLDEWEN
ncbi:Sir2 silent information regulator family NAD-dependent deacetylase [uncultured Traorella sp.]|uniref:SIR2 family NAD-dependent protein deacylase n=1 Tax=uncultured Traorella sp. TaxID=1929048 RepID=UPI0025F2832F|nr:Sir2 silent information regulator family NAD-dependent deacetylase [uncultured Traorella sp.]